MPELQLKCRWHRNWQKLRKGPTTSTKNIATTIGGEEENFRIFWPPELYNCYLENADQN